MRLITNLMPKMLQKETRLQEKNIKKNTNHNRVTEWMLFVIRQIYTSFEQQQQQQQKQLKLCHCDTLCCHQLKSYRHLNKNLPTAP